MRTGRYLRGILTLLLCSLLATACGNGTGSGTGQRVSQVALSLQNDQTPTGQTVSLQAANADNLHQLSCRIAYNPEALRFVDAARGELVDSRALFFTTSKGEAYVPVAFTYHAGEKIPAGTGAIAQLRFEVLNAGADPGLRVVTDDELLVARDASRRTIPVRVQGALR
jgi:predicted small secreted protein